MKKLIMIVLATILAMSTIMPVMAVEEKTVTVFEKDLSVCKKGEISVYGHSIRENIKGEWSDCDCSVFHYCTELYHILEDTTEVDFYSAFLNSEDYLIHPIGGIYQDCSSSMEETFCYEKSNIMANLSLFLKQKERNVKEVFKNQKTNLYGLLSSFGEINQGITIADETPIIITDLWDTKGFEEISRNLYVLQFWKKPEKRF